MDNLPWVEKYRPTQLDEIAGHEEVVQTVRNFIKNNQLPHLLFYGPPGTGKTSTINAIARELYGDGYKRMVLELNASDDRGIDVVREDIKTFASTRQIYSMGKNSSPQSRLKLVILDEADHMTNVAQNALRRTMEKYSATTRFCLLANYSHKLNPALVSRCSRHRFSPLSKEALLKRVQHVIEAEKVNISPEAVDALISQSGGDMRRALGVLQACNTRVDGQIQAHHIYECVGTPNPNDVERILHALLNDSWDSASQTITEIKESKGFALADILTCVGNEFEDIDKLTPVQRAKILSGLADIEFHLSGGGSEKLQTSAMIGAVKTGLC